MLLRRQFDEAHATVVAVGAALELAVLAVLR